MMGDLPMRLAVAGYGQGEAAVSLFRGWMYASSPALSALEHPVYDVWVLDCRNRSSSAPSTPEGDASRSNAASFFSASSSRSSYPPPGTSTPPTLHRLSAMHAPVRRPTLPTSIQPALLNPRHAGRW